MPIWVKCIFMLWAITFVLGFAAKVWATNLNNLPRIIKKDYPGWVIAFGASVSLSVLSVLPLAVWLIFFR